MTNDDLEPDRAPSNVNGAASDALVADTLRAQLQRAAPGLGEALIDTLTEALQTTKKVRVQRQCMKCGCTHIEYVEVQDSMAAINAAKVLIEQAEGRPGVAGDREGEGITIVRCVHLTVDAQHALALLDAGNLAALRLDLLSSIPVDPPACEGGPLPLSSTPRDGEPAGKCGFTEIGGERHVDEAMGGEVDEALFELR